jgi:hypothetical protein
MSEISLTYACGCRDVWEVSAVSPLDVLDETSTGPCVPTRCQTCGNDYARACPNPPPPTSIHNYLPVEWQEEKSVSRVIRSRAGKSPS